MKKVIISQRVIETESYYEIRDALSHDWISYLEGMALIPFPVPNQLKDVESFIQTIQPDLIILSGGNDVPDITDTSINSNSDIASSRNKLEFNLIKYAMENDIPLIGVCRGMQMLHLYFGGVVKKIENTTINHVNNTHFIEIIPSLFSNLLNIQRCTVNSFHHFGIELIDIVNPLQPFAMSLDKVVEGFYHPFKKVVGICWHPERSNPAHFLDEKIFDYLLQEGTI